jgi:hypothetical protein
MARTTMVRKGIVALLWANPLVERVWTLSRSALELIRPSLGKFKSGLQVSELRVIQYGAHRLGKSEQVWSGTLRRATSSRKTIVATLASFAKETLPLAEA